MKFSTTTGKKSAAPLEKTLKKFKGSEFKVQGLGLTGVTFNLLYKTTFKKLEFVLSWIILHFVGWVEPTPGFVGFRCTQSNLHFAGAIANCETQQWPISEPSPKSFYFD
jgi:hypothetical protein